MIEIVSLENLPADVPDILRTLIESTEGTIPGSRGFGLVGNGVDLRPMEARNIFFRELDDKVDIYLPEIRISDVEVVSADPLTLRIYIRRRS